MIPHNPGLPTAQLTLEGGVDGGAFIEAGSDGNVNEVKLTCTATGTPTPVVTFV